MGKLICVLLSGAALVYSAEALGSGLESYVYPYPVVFHSFQFDGQDVRMAYMDVKPSQNANGRSVVLFHGKNFFGAYWKDVIETLHTAGYRVIVPDQIGFGKSSKPEARYSFHEMARHTKTLLDKLGVKEAGVVGHSMGGMVAIRFALIYPDTVMHMVLENPIGLEDYRPKIPYAPTEAIYASELKKGEQDIRNYHKSYYVHWKPAYDEYVQVQFRWTLSGEYPRIARVSALTSQMIYEQPVVHELPFVRAKSLLIIGQEDRTAVGKDRAPAEVKKTLGNYPELGRAAAKAIPRARLVALAGTGHIPHLETPDRFQKDLLQFLLE